MTTHNMPNSTGKLGEQLAARYLQAKGYEIVACNFRVRGGEIDIIARRGKFLVFVEVKTRRTLSGGLPEESIRPAKLRHIYFAIGHYLQRYPVRHLQPQVDVICVILQAGKPPTLQHYENIS